jgi:hypothetical protein
MTKTRSNPASNATQSSASPATQTSTSPVSTTERLTEQLRELRLPAFRDHFASSLGQEHAEHHRLQAPCQASMQG